MTPERYTKVKEIFLAACEKPREEQSQFVEHASSGDAEVRREVESLLKEHGRDTQMMPSEPEGPLGSISAILSRANIELGPIDAGGRSAAERVAEGVVTGAAAGGRSHETTRYLDDSGSGSQDASSGIVDAGRFMAGTVAVGRYRIIELLGRGGMGEVYRADDIMLNQSVALKFLPALFGSDQKWLERFRNEVRLARQVTHPNVCRVFDIGEFQGEQFISMEYIDGENLASLLRRIGRVPHDKALQIARQLCAGLAAAHDRGVLHRDLKPANVMIDGRGSVRITDFGLAAPVDQFRAATAGGGGGGGGGTANVAEGAVRAGTPAYMSPEQLAGKAVTVRSDVYSLGLVLYEMFTGRRAFRADSLREYQKLHSTEDPTPPSEILVDIDPIVERVIMRCLEKDPKDRPSSAMAVSAALPGGNPLREILAAGETPSPEVVAAAGEAQGVIRPRTAIALLLTALACVIGFISIAPRVFVIQRALPEDAIVLRHEAQDLIGRLGYSSPPRDMASGFDVNRGYYLHVEAAEKTSRLWRLWRPQLGLVYFWYRQSPELLIPLRPDGGVVERDPGNDLPGMIEVRLDPQGHLVGLQVEPLMLSETVAAREAMPVDATEPVGVPEQRPPPPPPAQPTPTAPPPPAALVARGSRPATDWSPLLEAAQMTMTRFHAVNPQGVPPVFADERVAWEGTFDEQRLGPVRVEAAAYHGKPVYFAVIGNWADEPLSEDRAQVLSVGQSNLLVQTALLTALLIAGSMLAWKNYRSGRGDRQGATRIGLAFLLLGLISWVFRTHHVSDPVFEFVLFQRGMGPVLYMVCLVWVFYMALEPYVRRVWPETIISWSRLLTGKWIDPMVGRAVLVGGAIGVMSTLLSILEYQIPRWLNGNGPGTSFSIPLPSITSASLMLSAIRNYAAFFNAVIVALYLGLLLLLFLVLTRIVTRRWWAAATSFVVLFAIATARYPVGEAWWQLGAENWLSLTSQALLAMLFLALLTRHGLVGVIFCLLVRSFLMDFPVTWDLSVWYSGASIAAIAGVMLILCGGFYAAMGGRSPLHWRREG